MSYFLLFVCEESPGSIASCSWGACSSGNYHWTEYNPGLCSSQPTNKKISHLLWHWTRQGWWNNPHEKTKTTNIYVISKFFKIFMFELQDQNWNKVSEWVVMLMNMNNSRYNRAPYSNLLVSFLDESGALYHRKLSFALCIISFTSKFKLQPTPSYSACSCFF